MRSTLAVCTLAFAATMAAQESVQMTVQKAVTGPTGSKTTTQVVRVTPRCPVAMHLSQGGGMQMLRADDGTTQPLLTPSLTLAPVDHRMVVDAKVTIHGAAPGARILPLVSEPAKGNKPEPELTRTVELTLKPDDVGEPTAEMSLTGFGFLTRIELNSLTYADGTTWKLAKDSACSVAPDPLLLVAAH